MNDTTQQRERPNMPVETFREGAIGASVWEREGKNGTFYEVTLSRAYLGNGKVGYTGCFRLRDMEQLDEVLLRARRWMAEQEEPGRLAKKDESLPRRPREGWTEGNGAA